MHRWHRLILAGYVWSAVGSAATLNLVRNGSFEETDAAGWAVGWAPWPETLAPGASVSIDENIAHTGRRSLRITHRDRSAYSRADQVVPVTPGRQVMISCWIRAADLEPVSPAGGVRLFIGRDGSGNPFRSLAPVQTRGSFPWTRCEIGPVAVGDQTRLAFLPYLHQTSGTVWYDDIEMVEVTPDMARRIEQMRVRNLLLADLSLIERCCLEADDATARAEVAAAMTRLSETADLPTAGLDRRRGPPFCPQHQDVHAILARALARRHPGRDLIVWRADPFARQPHLALPPMAADAGPIAVTALRHDTEQVALNLTNTTPAALPVRLALAGLDDAVAAVWREVIPVEVRDGILIDDALPRLPVADGEAVVVVPPGMTRQIWLELCTGDRTGRLDGTIQLRWQDRIAQMPLALHIHDLVFPEPWPLNTFNYAYLSLRPLTRGRIAVAAADLARHHINAIMPEHGSQGVPGPVLAPDGTLQPDRMDWSAFDATLATSGYAHTILVALSLKRLKAMFATVGETPPAFGSPAWEQRAVSWVQAVVAGLQSRGFGHDRVLWVPTDEPSGSSIDDALITGTMLRRADPGIRIYSNFYRAATPEEVRRLDPVIDVWAPHLDCLNDDYLPVCTARTRALWAYRVQGKDTPPASVRGAFWRLFETGVTGYSFWAYTDASPDPWDPYDTSQHDYHVVYDGDPTEMVPSKRWEAWREGVEDYALLWLLARRAAGPDLTLAALRGTISERAGAEAIAAARERLLEALTGAAEPRGDP
ncbi:MAG: DUF4091 domain-containing protein [Lentisphaerae bacterium]|nr:DUF4091 domain-containing protein [Lentisphaerota bacterium]